MAAPTNPSTPVQAQSGPLAPPQLSLPIVNMDGTPTVFFFQFLQLIYAGIQGGGGIIDLLARLPGPTVSGEEMTTFLPLATAATTVLAKLPSDNILLTGAVAVSSFGPGRSGLTKVVRVQDGFLLQADPAKLLLANDAQNRLTRAGDAFTAVCLGGSKWAVVGYTAATVVSFGPVRMHAGATTFDIGNVAAYVDDASLTLGAFDTAVLKVLSVYRNDLLATNVKTGVAFDYVYSNDEFRWGRTAAGVFTAYLSFDSTGSLVPVTTDQIDLGKAGRRWKDGWFGGDLTAAGAITGNTLVSTTTIQAGTDIVAGGTLTCTEVIIGGLQVMGPRDAGWTAMTGTATKGGFDTASVTLPQLAEVVKAITDAGLAQGWIGA